jgi:hypothetical protein
MAGYTRTDTTNNIADGNVINAADFDNEYNAIEAAFNASTGHTHDGTSAEGAPITKVGPAQDVTVSINAVLPKTDNTVDLGSGSLEFKDLYIDGTANIDSLVADTADINGGTIDNATIATSNITVGSGKTLNVSAGTLTLADNQISGDKVEGGTINAITINTLTSGTVDINGGAIDGTTIGAASASTGAFTTLSSSSTTTLNGTTIPSSVTLVSTAATQTLTNKTLTSPVIGTIVNTGTLTLPTATDTLVGRATTDTLTNKTISADNNTLSGIAASSFVLSNASGNIDGAAAQKAIPSGVVVGTTDTQTLTNKTLNTGTAITAGTINGATIGATTASTGAFTTLSATGVTTVQAGTVSAPAITTSGDTNTGIFFPAADTIAFSEGGAEAMRIDSSGNVGIGTSAPARRLQVSNTSGDSYIGIEASNANISGILFADPDDNNIGRLSYDHATDSLQSWTNNQERMRIDSAGNLGLGVTPSAWQTTNSVRALEFNAGSVFSFGSASINLYQNAYLGASNAIYSRTGSAAGAYAVDLGIHKWFTAPSGTAGDAISFTERMRITGDGNVGIGTSSPGAKLEVLGNSADIRINESGGGDLRLSVTGSTTRLNAFSNHPMLFLTNNNERMRITGDGNVGIGTSSPATKLVLAGDNSGLAENNTLRFWDTDGGTEANQQLGKIEFFSSDASTPGASVKAYIGAFAQDTTPDVYLSFATDTTTGTPTERMRITNTGNVGIGTNSPGARLDVGYVAGSVALRVSRDADSRLDFYQGGGISYIDSSPAGGQLAFATVGTERARITSAGSLLVGTTTNLGAGGISLAPFTSGFAVVNNNSAAASGFVFQSFRRSGTEIGFIDQNGTTAVRYSTTSDYRLKEDVAPMTGALAKVAQLKPCTYKWKADGSDGEGFIAHELQEICPAGVSGTKDAVDEEGNPRYQGIDTSFLVATLTAAIQEQQAIIESLKARLDAANI